MSSTGQPMLVINKQAIMALVMGIATIVFALLVNITGSYTVLSVLVMFSALVAVNGGHRALGQIRGQQRALALVGIISGITGLVLYVIFLVNSINIYQKLPEPQTFKGHGLLLIYPGSWQTIEMGQMPACKQSNVSCVLAVRQPDRTTVNIIQTMLAKADTIDGAQVWQQIQVAIPNAHRTSQETITVGGRPAGRVICDAPSSDVPGGHGYFLVVEVANGLSPYTITAAAVSADALAAHRADIDSLISSISFTP